MKIDKVTMSRKRDAKKVKCLTCPFNEDSFCKKLNHPLENGYAMLAHSKYCRLYD